MRIIIRFSCLWLLCCKGSGFADESDARLCLVPALRVFREIRVRAPPCGINLDPQHLVFPPHLLSDRFPILITFSWRSLCKPYISMPPYRIDAVLIESLLVISLHSPGPVQKLRQGADKMEVGMPRQPHTLAYTKGSAQIVCEGRFLSSDSAS